MSRSSSASAGDAKKPVTHNATQLRGALKLKDACAYLGGLSVPTVHRLIERGLLRPNRALRHLLFPIAELDRFLRDGMSGTTCEAKP